MDAKQGARTTACFSIAVCVSPEVLVFDQKCLASSPFDRSCLFRAAEETDCFALLVVAPLRRVEMVSSRDS